MASTRRSPPVPFEELPATLRDLQHPLGAGLRSVPRRALSSARTNTTTLSRLAISIPATGVWLSTISDRRASLAVRQRMPRVTFTASPSAFRIGMTPGLWRGSLVPGAEAMAGSKMWTERHASA